MRQMCSEISNIVTYKARLESFPAVSTRGGLICAIQSPVRPSTTQPARGLSRGPRRITSVSIKTDQYRVTRSRGRGKYPTKSFNTRTTLRQRRQQPLYCLPIALFSNIEVNVERQQITHLRGWCGWTIFLIIPVLITHYYQNY